MISPTVQALIDTAEADVPITAGLADKVTGDQAQIAGSELTLTADQAALKTAQDKQFTDAKAALDALATELGVPAGTLIGPPPPPPTPAQAMAAKPLHPDDIALAKAKTRIYRSFMTIPRVAQAHALGIDWGTILQTILAAGLPALEQLIQDILAGLGKPKPTPAPAA